MTDSQFLDIIRRVVKAKDRAQIVDDIVQIRDETLSEQTVLERTLHDYKLSIMSLHREVRARMIQCYSSTDYRVHVQALDDIKTALDNFHRDNPL